MIPYVLALEEMYPGSSWAMSDGDYDTLQWFSSSPKPTKQELDSQIETALHSRKCKNARKQRDYLLQTEVDPIVLNILRWGSLTQQQQQAVAQYRQLLLDIPQQVGFPDNIVWPSLSY